MHTTYTDVSVEGASPVAEAYLDSVTHAAAGPVDLPTGAFDFDTMSPASEDAALTSLENQAHAQKVLLSSDAMRYFIGKVPSEDARGSALDTVLAQARISFPSEDGWVVVNLARMETLLSEMDTEEGEMTADTAIDLSQEPITSGSLAEAILAGNTTASYTMISNRPMVALADATTDLDALYRFKKGEDPAISEMLKKEGSRLSEEQLQEILRALTSALDGTYTDEEYAVKMAIMKAIKIIG